MTRKSQCTGVLPVPIARTLPAFQVLTVTLCFLGTSGFAQTTVWSPPVDVSQATQPASATAMVIDANDTVHLFFDAIPGFGEAAQVFHAYRRPGQPWSGPVVISTPGSPNIAAVIPESSAYQFVQEDRTGTLHCFFRED